MRAALVTLRAGLAALLMAGLIAAVWAGPPVYKCTIDGTTTFQRIPCPTGEPPAATPSVDQLNAQRQRKLKQAAAASVPQARPPAADRPAASAVRPSTRGASDASRTR